MKLREIFIEYYKSIKIICEKEKDIIKDIKNFYDIDEFAYQLNENIKNFFKAKKGKLNNSEIFGYIHKHKRESYILDGLAFEYDYKSNDEDVIKDHEKFIETFRKLEYEKIFKDNMVKFLDIMINKITNISSIDTTMDLIRVDRIKEKVNEFFEKLKDKYDRIIKNEINNLGKDKPEKPVEIIAKFVKLIFEMKIIAIFRKKFK